MITDNYPLGFKLALHRKDLGIALDEAGRDGSNSRSPGWSPARSDALIAEGFGDEDISALARIGQAPARPHLPTDAVTGSNSNWQHLGRLVEPPAHGVTIGGRQRDHREPVAGGVVVVFRQPLTRPYQDLDVGVPEPPGYLGGVGHRAHDRVGIGAKHEARRHQIGAGRRQFGRPAGDQRELQLVGGNAVNSLDQRCELRCHAPVDLDDVDVAVGVTKNSILNTESSKSSAGISRPAISWIGRPPIPATRWGTRIARS